MGKYFRTPCCRIPNSLLYVLLGAIATIFVLLLIDTLKSSDYDDEEDSEGDPIPYERLPQDAVLMVPELISKMDWGKNEKVLNYQCGNNAVGYHLIFRHLKKHSSRLFAVDSNWVNIEMAKTTFTHPDIVYGEANLIRNPPTFPFYDVQFDKVFAIFVFHFAPDMQQLLERLRDVLKPGGQLAFTMLSEHNVMQKLKQVLLKFPKWKKYATYKPAGVETKEDMEKKTKNTFEAAGFKVKYWRVQQMEGNKVAKYGEVPIDNEYIIGVVERLH